MTTQDIINYYANLLIIQYKGKPKAYATIQTVVTPVIMDQLPTKVMNAFNLIGSSPAVGVQLDVLGKYVGVKRTGVGFNGQITLNDADFLTLIQFAIIRNHAGSDLAEIQALMNQFFPGEVLVFDYSNMHMSYLISSSIGSQNLIQLVVSEGLLPKPMGVALSTTVYTPTITSFFGFRTYFLPAFRSSPFNSYASVETVNFPAIPASGTFELVYSGSPTAAINWNDSAATIQTKLRAVVGLSAVMVTGSIASQNVYVTFCGVSNPAATMTIAANSLQDSGSHAVVPVVTLNARTGPWLSYANGVIV